MIAGDPAAQWEWHETFRDQSKNMYRTSYSDMAHFREVHVKSDFPSGYGGHVRSIRHDVLHRNTAFDRKMVLQRTDPSRDAFPSFIDQLAGLPTSTKYPCGARNNPTKGVVKHDGTTTMLKPPWGVMTGVRDPLNMRTAPPTMRRNTSLPALGSSMRANDAAMNAGSLLARNISTPTQEKAPAPVPVKSVGPMSPNERLRQTVHTANEDAKKGTSKTEAEILEEEINMM